MRSLSPEVTPGPRADILAVVHTTPGIHLRSVERETGLPLGQVLYHLDRLERMGLVVSARDAGFRRYYPSRDVGRGEKRYLAALRTQVPRHVLLALLEGPSPQSHKELQAAVGVAGSTLSFHLQRLLAAGVLDRTRQGATNLYAITDPGTVRRELVYYRESFRDEKVDRFVRSQLEALPPLGGSPLPVHVEVEVPS